MIYSSLLYGGLDNSSSLGNSVARAKDAKESMIRLTQSNWIDCKGD